MKLASALVVPLLVLIAAPARADDILMRNGRDITGVRIQNETGAKIEYTKPGVGSPQSVDSADVRDVRYGRTSAEFVQAVDFRDNGSMGEAAQYFLAAEEDEGLPAHVRATALIEAADALFASNYLPDALAEYSRFVSSYAGSRHYPRALLGQGKTMLYSRKFADAEKVFAKLEQEASSKGLDERWGLEAEFYKLFAAEAQGRDVAAGYTDLRSRTKGSHQGIANQCSLRMGRVNHASGRLDEAERLFSEIIASRLDTDAEVVAGAYTGRGRISFDRGLLALRNGTPAGNAEALEHFHDARLDFLRVYVNYRGVTREQPEALYWAGEAFLNVGSLDPDEPDAGNWGLILLDRCRRTFAETEWGQKAALPR